VDHLDAVLDAARGCTRCPALVEARERVVPGAGAAGARLVLVGEAPGREEEARGEPLVGRAGSLLDDLLGAAGVAREDVVRTTVVRCRPPGRDPLPAEVAACLGWLHAIVDAVRPRVVAPVGSFATKVLRADPAPIGRVHGVAEDAELGGVRLRLLPLHHPDAALYAPAVLEALRADVARIPALLELPPPAEPEPEPSGDPQLGLF
jgi:uracil-DNA glycosylase